MNKHRSTINIGLGYAHDLNERLAYQQGIPEGETDCLYCKGRGYHATVTGPIPCSCTNNPLAYSYGEEA